MTFKIIERFFTIVALVECLTRCTSKMANHTGIKRSAMGTLNTRRFIRMVIARTICSGNRRCNTIMLEFLFAEFGHPVGGPSRRQLLYQCHRLKSRNGQFHPNMGSYHIHSGATAVSWGNSYLHMLPPVLILHRYMPYHTKIQHRNNRYFRIGYIFEHTPYIGCCKTGSVHFKYPS